MATSSLARKAGVLPARPSAADGLNGLVRRMIKQVNVEDCHATLHELDGEIVELICDVEIDGFRCVLTRAQPRPERAHVVLSPREQEIARMVAKGYPNKTIAAVLEISSWTVCTYLRRIFAKLSVCSRAAMVARLIEEGFSLERNEPAKVLPRGR